MKIILFVVVSLFSFNSLADQLPVQPNLPVLWDCLDGTFASDPNDCEFKGDSRTITREKFLAQIRAKGMKVPPKGARIIKGKARIKR